ncbi:MAG: zinc ABC transporter substrate-binding protein [Flavobacteriaceae bacterium]|nr:zinc ABC transporter substrate-binding protein [Flavobacteriaceae bacterium]
MKKTTYILLLISLVFVGCKKQEKKESDQLNIVTTTTMITDLLKEIGGDKISLQGLMGTGVDPHLYKAIEGDVTKLFEADIVFYNGLHLESKLEEVFENMRRQNKKTIAVSSVLDKNILIGSEYFASNYDPHVWFDVYNWELITNYVTQQLIDNDPKNKLYYEANKKDYLIQLKLLRSKLIAQINQLPKEKRILVTAHDAFNYFGKALDFQVVGLQGLSTATEAGVQDVQKLASFIIENKIKAIFVESSVPKKTIEALQESVKAQGHEVSIGGTLYSDALGNPNTVEGTYIGMYEHNVNTIVNALK